MRQIGPARNPGMARLFPQRQPQQEKRRARPEAAGGARGDAAAGRDRRCVRPQHAAGRGGAARHRLPGDRAPRNPRIVYAWASGCRPGTAVPRAGRVRRRDPGRKRPRRAQRRGRRRAALRADGGRATRSRGHVLACAVGMALYRPRAHRQGPGGARADDGDDGRLQPRRPSLARRVRRAGKGARLPAHADARTAGPMRPRTGMSASWRRPTAQWRNLFAAMDCPELADDERFATIGGRTANIDELYTMLAERMRRRTTAEWRERLDAVRRAERRRQRPRRACSPTRISNETGFFERVEHPTEGKIADDGDPGQLFRDARRQLAPAAAASRRAHARDARRTRLLRREIDRNRRP